MSDEDRDINVLMGKIQGIETKLTDLGQSNNQFFVKLIADLTQIATNIDRLNQQEEALQQEIITIKRALDDCNNIIKEIQTNPNSPELINKLDELNDRTNLDLTTITDLTQERDNLMRQLREKNTQIVTLDNQIDTLTNNFDTFYDAVKNNENLTNAEIQKIFDKINANSPPPSPPQSPNILSPEGFSNRTESFSEQQPKPDSYLRRMKEYTGIGSRNSSSWNPFSRKGGRRTRRIKRKASKSKKSNSHYRKHRMSKRHKRQSKSGRRVKRNRTRRH